LTQTEKVIVDKEQKNITLKMFQSVPFSESTLVIMIDTTMYDIDSIKEYKDCYKYALESESETDNPFETAKLNQVKFMNSVVNQINAKDSIRNIVIIGHHPIIYYKIKEQKVKKDKKDNEDKKEKKEKKFNVNIPHLSELSDFLYEELYKKLKESDRDYSYYYLCADLHQYQSGNVTIGKGDDIMNIRQYIAGTGGAEKDKYDASMLNTETVIINDTTYTMSMKDIDTSTEENGFLICRENEDKSLDIKFLSVNDQQGGKTKRTKRKNKKTYKKHTKKHLKH
jgi:hypothetical protein